MIWLQLWQKGNEGDPFPGRGGWRILATEGRVTQRKTIYYEVREGHEG
jgi:hypothetical protein